MSCVNSTNLGVCWKSQLITGYYHINSNCKIKMLYQEGNTIIQEPDKQKQSVTITRIFYHYAFRVERQFVLSSMGWVPTGSKVGILFLRNISLHIPPLESAHHQGIGPKSFSAA